MDTSTKNRLGGEELLARVRALVKAKPKTDELRWTARAESGGQRLAAAQALAVQQEDRRLQIWLRVRLGGVPSFFYRRGCNF